MQRHPGQNWDDGGKDVSLMIQWVQANIAKYKGNPDRMFIWAQSAGNGPLCTYLGRPELYGPKGVGVKGAIFMSGQFNILPVQPAAQGRGGPAAGNPLAGAGSTCGATGANAADGPHHHRDVGLRANNGINAFMQVVSRATFAVPQRAQRAYPGQGFSWAGHAGHASQVA